MRMLWDLYKARAHKRKQKFMRERDKKMAHFMGNILAAYEHYNTFDKVDDETFYKNVYSMPFKYANWVSSKVLQHEIPMSEHEMTMDEMCRLMLLWRETSTKKREAQGSRDVDD
jgi:hypothetical protein